MPAPISACDQTSWQDEYYRRASAWLEQHPPSLLGGSAVEGCGAGDLVRACTWVLLRQQIAPAPPARADLAGWARLLQALQDPRTGQFIAPSDTLASQPDEAQNAVSRALTARWLEALNALYARPVTEVPSFTPLETAAGATAWWDALDWSNAALAGEDVTSVAIGLVHRAEIERQPGAFAAYHRMLDWLEGVQEARSGLFGATPANFPWRSVVGSASILAAFAYVHRPVQRAARVIDAILSLQESDDGLARTRGTAVEALASVRLLVLLGRHSTYRASEVRACLLRTYQAIVQLQQEDGGVPVDAVPAAESTGAPHGADPLGALYLRVLTLGAIETRYRGHQPSSGLRPGQDWPGLGYLGGDTGALTPHERAVLPAWTRQRAHAGRSQGGTDRRPVLTVVVPCFNLGRYLHDAVESVLAQTFQELEIVIVDDGSTDEYTRLLLAGFDRPRTRIVRQENRGLAGARNEGIDRGTGRYLCCLDPDDRLRPTFFERAVAILDADPAVGLVSGYFEMFDEREGTFRFESCDFPRLLVHNLAIEPAVFRREAWKRAGGYCPAFSASGIEDWDLWISLIELGYRAEVIPEIVWEYRIRSDQMSTGMYQPETWSRLVRELVARHPAAYQAHLADVVALHAHRWADLRGWANERENALGWWQRQAGNWERLVGERDRRIAELQAAIRAREEDRREGGSDPT